MSRRPGSPEGGWLPTALDRGCLLAAVTVPGVLYLATLYPGLGGRVSVGDAVKFQYIGRILGVPHEPGYPQYVLLTWLWSWLPWPASLAVRINLFSTVTVLLAGALVFVLARHLSRSAIAAMLAVWFLLLGRDVWTFATQAEVYGLNLLWVAVVLIAGWAWRATGRRAWLVAMMLCYALSFGNHRLMITLLPALVLLVLATDASVFRSPRMLAVGAGATLLGLAQYGLPYWRSWNPHPTLLANFPREASFLEVLRWSMGERFTDKHLLADGIGAWPGRFAEVWFDAADELGPILLVAAAIGAWVLARRDAVTTAMLGLVAFVVTAFVAAYQIADWELYAAPAWLAVAVLAAVGLAPLLRHGVAVRAGTLALLVALLVVPTWRNVAAMRLADSPLEHRAVIEAAPPGAVVVTTLSSRLARNLRRYYRYGLGIRKAARLEIVDGDRLLAKPALVLRSGAVHVQRRLLASWLAGHGVDHRVQPRRFSDPDAAFVRVEPEPLRRIEYDVTPAGRVTIRLRRAVEQLPRKPLLVVTVVDGRTGLARGSLRWRLDRGPPWQERLDATLRMSRPGDTVSILALRTDEDARRALFALLQDHGLALDASLSAPRLVIAFQHGVPASLLVAALQGGFTVPVPRSTRTSGRRPGTADTASRTP